MSRHFRLSSELTGAIAKRLPHAKNQLSAPGSFFNQFVTDIYIYIYIQILIEFYSKDLFSAHLMYGIGFHINKKFKIKKDIRRLFLHVIGFMVRCTELSKINNIFNSLCRVFMSKYFDESVLSHIAKLDSYISEDSQISPDISNDLETEITDSKSIIEKDVKTYKEKSPFGRHKIARICQDNIKNNLSKIVEKFDFQIFVIILIS